MAKINLHSVDTYIQSSLDVLEKNLRDFFDDISGLTVKDIKEKLEDVNSYKNLEHLENLDHLFFFRLHLKVIVQPKRSLLSFHGKPQKVRICHSFFKIQIDQIIATFQVGDPLKLIIFDFLFALEIS